MIVTYSSGSPGSTVKGPDWEAYRWRKSGDTLIIDHLWNECKRLAEEQIPFEECHGYLNKAKKTSGLKSYASISTWGGHSIEVLGSRGILPRILLTTNIEENEQ